MKGYWIICICCLDIVGASICAQTRSNRGKEFWLGYGHNILFNYPQPNYGVNSQTQTLYISTEEAANVTISINGTSWVKNLSIPANSVDASVVLPKDGSFDTRIRQEGKFERGIHVKSDVPIVVYTHQFAFWSSTATMLMPVETYGYKYYSINYKQQVLGIDSAFSWFYVIASEDNTRIEITPSDSTQGPPGTVWKGWEPGKKYTVELNRGELYNVFGLMSKKADANGIREGKDMTGSKIVSVSGSDGKCHPIAVFSGSSRLTFCDGDGGEVMQQQIFPASAWGTRYLTYHSRANPGVGLATPFLNFYRISVQDPSTVVKKNGMVMSGLKQNFYYEYQTDGGDYIEADKPIIVTQYTPSEWQCNPPKPLPTFGGPTGDPEMYILSPIEQGINKARFFKTKNFNATSKYVNVIVPNAGLSSLTLDGGPIASSSTVIHPNNPDYTVVSVRLFGADGQHYLECDSVFNAITFGVGEWESYGYNAGTYINNLNAVTEIRSAILPNPKKDSITCVKTPFRAFVSVGYKLNSMKWRFSEVSGLNISKDTLMVDPIPLGTYQYYGRTYYTYTLNLDLLALQQGKFIIPITYTSPDIDECSQAENTEVIFTATAGLSTDFTSSTACLGDTIMFTGKTSTLPNVKYRWDFDDKSFLETKDVRKAFLSGAKQNVRFRIFAENGCVGDTTKVINLFTSPDLKMNVNGKFCVDSLVQFSSSYPLSGGAGKLYWDFGDGKKDSSTSSVSVSHRYITASTNLKAKHWVLDINGCRSDTVHYLLATINPTPAAPVVVVSADSLCPNSSIRFESILSNASSWNWDFGDGSRSTQASPISKVYGIAGNYIVRLRYVDANGCSSLQATQPVRINARPIISAGPDQYIKKGSSSILSGISNSTNVDVLWAPALYLDDPTLLKPVCLPELNMTYVMKVTERESKCVSTDTVKIFLLNAVDVPNTFTPNGDGINDKWEIASLGAYPKCVVEVYNTAGQQVYRTRGYISAWDGKSKGRELPAGTYYYVIDYGTGDPKKAGYVTILR